MKIIKPQSPHYEILEKLGEGLTSEVYRANRRDKKGWTQQPVALKIIKSKKNIQVLRQEFEKLLKVRSKYCVQMMGWESLPQGPALILEYIEGTTVDLLHKKNLLTEELVREIAIQVYMGLGALHRVQVFHGDLNLKNILLTTEGVVKLIDFGFFSSDSTRMLTTFFADPRTIAGKTPDRESDLYSLNRIADYLLESLQEGSTFSLRIEGQSSKANRRRSLAKVVSFAMKTDKKTTVTLENPRFVSRKARVGPALLFSIVFLGMFVQPLFWQKKEVFGELKILSNHWVQYSLNKMPALYGPVAGKKLRAGQYNIDWQTPHLQKNELLEIQQNQTILLQPQSKNL